MKRLKIASAAAVLTLSLFSMNTQAALEAGAKAPDLPFRARSAVNR